MVHNRLVMVSAIVLCAGFGTRLRPLTQHLPKPLMPVGDRPIIAHLVDVLRSLPVHRIVANLHHLAIDFEREINRLGIDVEVVREEKILGTAGGVANAAGALGAGPIVIWNGDILAPELDVPAALDRFAQSGQDALWVVEPTDAGRGTVGLDEQGNVVRLRGEVFGRETQGGEYLGIQVMSAEQRRTLPSEGCLVADVALPMLRRGGKIATFAHRAPWDDIGQPAALLLANLRWLERRGLAAWSAPDAAVAAGVRLERAIVGAGARVDGTGMVSESIVFPGAEACAPTDRMLLAKSCSLSVPSP
jgi:mannose-1-phosphate guanylyltransferase